MSEHRDSGAAAPALQQSREQQSLEQQPLPVARGLPREQWHWGPWDGAPACHVRAHTHTVPSNDLLGTREQSSSWRKDGAARDGSRAPRDGMGRMESAQTGKEQRKEEVRKKKRLSPSSSCWRERESNAMTVRHSTTNY